MLRFRQALRVATSISMTRLRVAFPIIETMAIRLTLRRQALGDHFKYDGTNWVLEIASSDGVGGATTFIALTDTPGSLTEGRYLRVDSSGNLEEVIAAPVETEKVILYEDTTARIEDNAEFFTIALTRAPLPGHLLDIEIFFDGFQVPSNASDSPEDRYNTLIPMLLESDDFLSRPVHTSTNDPTGSIPFKTTRDVQNLSLSAGFSHTTIYVAKANESMVHGCASVRRTWVILAVSLCVWLSIQRIHL